MLIIPLLPVKISWLPTAFPACLYPPVVCFQKVWFKALWPGKVFIVDLCRAYNKGSGPVASPAIQIKNNNSDTFLIWGYLGIKLLEAYDFDIQSAVSHVQLSLTTWSNKLPLGRWEPQFDSRVSFKDVMLAFVVISSRCAQFVLKGMKGTSYSGNTWPAWELCFRGQLHNLYCHFRNLTACNTSSCLNSPMLKFHCNVKNKQSRKTQPMKSEIPGLQYYYFFFPMEKNTHTKKLF